MSENKAETVAAAAESNDNPKAGVDFIRARIMDDNASGRFGGWAVNGTTANSTRPTISTSSTNTPSSSSSRARPMWTT